MSAPSARKRRTKATPPAAQAGAAEGPDSILIRACAAFRIVNAVVLRDNGSKLRLADQDAADLIAARVELAYAVAGFRPRTRQGRHARNQLTTDVAMIVLRDLAAIRPAITAAKLSRIEALIGEMPPHSAIDGLAWIANSLTAAGS